MCAVVALDPPELAVVCCHCCRYAGIECPVGIALSFGKQRFLDALKANDMAYVGMSFSSQ
jgi:hypothetical protein